MKIYSYPHDKNKKNSDNEILASVKDYLSGADADISVERDQFGKPHIVGIDGIYVSVAHDKELCLVAVARSDIGIDLEREDRKVRNSAALAKRYFCEDEIAFLGDDPTDAEFTDMWVRKEALSKLLGKGVPSMRDKSVFSEDVIFTKVQICDGYVSYCVQYIDQIIK